MNQLFNLEGKVAVVIGASGGLGSDAAYAYATSGASVALLARSKNKLEKLAADLKESGTKALAIACDIKEEESIKYAVDQIIKEFGHIDILLNCFGTSVSGSVTDIDIQDWEHVNEINLRGVYLACKHILPYMKDQNYGKIINIASIHALIGVIPDEQAVHVYSATKAGIVGLTRSIAATYAKYGITVNAIAPGLFRTNMTENSFFAIPQMLDMYNSMCPAGRPSNKGDLNGTVIYLSSDASAYVTGQLIAVDGGFVIA